MGMIPFELTTAQGHLHRGAAASVFGPGPLPFSEQLFMIPAPEEGTAT